jgi:hypothetical protein
MSNTAAVRYKYREQRCEHGYVDMGRGRCPSCDVNARRGMKTRHCNACGDELYGVVNGLCSSCREALEGHG